MTYTRHIRIEFNHCDPAGIVFYPRYFEMTNSVVENFFADEVGMSFAQMHNAGMRNGVPTVHIEADFMAPSRLGDKVAFTLIVRKLGGSSVAVEITGRMGEELRLRLRTPAGLRDVVIEGPGLPRGSLDESVQRACLFPPLSGVGCNTRLRALLAGGCCVETGIGELLAPWTKAGVNKMPKDRTAARISRIGCDMSGFRKTNDRSKIGIFRRRSAPGKQGFPAGV